MWRNFWRRAHFLLLAEIKIKLSFLSRLRHFFEIGGAVYHRGEALFWISSEFFERSRPRFFKIKGHFLRYWWRFSWSRKKLNGKITHDQKYWFLLILAKKLKSAPQKILHNFDLVGSFLKIFVALFLDQDDFITFIVTLKKSPTPYKKLRSRLGSLFKVAVRVLFKI